MLSTTVRDQVFTFSTQMEQLLEDSTRHFKVQYCGIVKIVIKQQCCLVKNIPYLWLRSQR